MARILVSVESETDRKTITSALDGDRHELLEQESGLDVAGHGAQTVIDHQADLVITDYVEQDAISVKVMQDVALSRPFTKFLFIIPDNVSRHHLILAINEGAAAILNRPLDAAAVRNYIARTLHRQKKEMAWAEEVEQCRKAAEREKNCSLEQAVEISDLKRSLRAGHRLINHLLAVNMGGKKTKVLLITDSGYQLDRFRAVLTEHNFDVVSAGNGADGWEAALKFHPRIIVSDLEMPGINGVELCRKVKNEERLAPNYFIICTANEDKIHSVLQPDNKVDDCLLKPRTADEFQEFTARVAVGIIT